MEAKLYRTLYQQVHAIAHPPRAKGQLYSDHWIVMVYLWSVVHDRPRCWACDPEHWPKELDRPLPSASRLCRRLKTLSVQQLLERALDQAVDDFGVPLVKQLDSKPLVVGPYSKDTDAKRGRLARGLQGRGYRLHVLSHGRIPRHWTLLPLNAHDSLAAAQLLERLAGQGYVTADNAYDANACYELAAKAGHQLVAPPRACNRGVRDARHNCPQRLRGLDIIDPPLRHASAGAFGAGLYKLRQRIESGFGALTFAGLGALPPWVRRPRRVALFAAAKLLLFAWQQRNKKRHTNTGVTAMRQ
jgi:IS5 family transposase